MEEERKKSKVEWRIEPFVIKEDLNEGLRWAAWRAHFELLVNANNLRDEAEKKMRLLIHGGKDIQMLYNTLPEAQNEDESKGYEVLMKALDQQLNRQKLKVYERETFRKLNKNPHEKVDEFVVRLRQQIKMCGLGNEVQEIMIIDKIIDNCEEPVLRSRLREKDYELKEILGIARQVELEITRNKTERTSTAGNVDSIRTTNKKLVRGRFDSNSTREERTCFNCGKSGHIASAVGCPARGKKCSKCERIGHFQSTCRKRSAKDEQFGKPKYQRLTTALVEEKTEYRKKHEEQYLFYTGGVQGIKD